jgi:hypothetical protein
LGGYISEGCFERAAVSDQWAVLQEGLHFRGYHFAVSGGETDFTAIQRWNYFLEDGEEVWSLHIAEPLDRAVVWTDRGNLYFLTLTDETPSRWVKVPLPGLAGAWPVCRGTECVAVLDARFYSVALGNDAAHSRLLGDAPPDLWDFDFNAETLLAATDRGVVVEERTTEGLRALGFVPIPYPEVHAGPGYHLAVFNWEDPHEILLIATANGLIRTHSLHKDLGDFTEAQLPYIYHLSPGNWEWPGRIAESFLRPDGKLEAIRGEYTGQYTALKTNGKSLLTFSPAPECNQQGFGLYRSCAAVPDEYRPTYHELCDGLVQVSTAASVESLVCDRGTAVDGGYRFEKLSCDIEEPHLWFTCTMRQGEWNVDWDFRLPCRGTDAIHIDGDRFLEPDRATMISGPEGYAEYAWSDGTSGRERTISQSGAYGLTVRTMDGCERTDASHLVAPTKRDTPRTLVPFPALGLPVRISAANPWNFPVNYGMDIPGRAPQYGVIPPHGQVRLEPDPEICSDTAGFLQAEAPVAYRVEVKPGPWWATIPFGESHRNPQTAEQANQPASILTVNRTPWDVPTRWRPISGQYPQFFAWTPPQESRLLNAGSPWYGFFMDDDSYHGSTL